MDVIANDKRVRFDFEVDFSNGGGIQGQDFRLDIDGDDIDDTALAEYIVRDLQLLMVGEVRILNKQVITERHKRTARPTAPADSARPDLIDLTQVVHNGDDMNSGTVIDAQCHPDRDDVLELPLASIADLDAVVVRLSGSADPAIGTAALAATDVGGRAVFIDTGWAATWGTPAYREGSPFLTGEGAEHLRDRGARLVGIDTSNIDDTGDLDQPAHSTLLAAGIPIVQNLARLDGLPTSGLRFSAVPMRVRRMGTFRVRAWARMVAGA